MFFSLFTFHILWMDIWIKGTRSAILESFLYSIDISCNYAYCDRRREGNIFVLSIKHVYMFFLIFQFSILRREYLDKEGNGTGYV